MRVDKRCFTEMLLYKQLLDMVQKLSGEDQQSCKEFLGSESGLLTYYRLVSRFAFVAWKIRLLRSLVTASYESDSISHIMFCLLWGFHLAESRIHRSFNPRQTYAEVRQCVLRLRGGAVGWVVKRSTRMGM